jgi:hypothetical protein
MLQVNDKINYIKNGRIIATDTVVMICKPIAYTRFGKRFLINAEILFPIIGHRSGFKYEKELK